MKKDGTPLDVPELQNEDNDKTVEELLAELGPEDHWTLGKDEDLEIDALLKDAHVALKDVAPEENTTRAAAAAKHQNLDTAKATPAPTPSSYAPAINLSAFQLEPELDSSAPPSPSAHPQNLDQEAELTLQRLLDEIALDPTPSTLTSQADGNYEAGLNLPSAGKAELASASATVSASQGPELDPPPPYCAGSCLNEAVDDTLARRFASLSLPQSLPQRPADGDDALSLSLPSVPIGIKPPTQSQPKATSSISPDEVDTWCSICLDDANVKCLGCEGELYCTKCWMEGHTGEDAGYEERRHRAVEYVKGGGVKKKARRLVGA